MLLPHILDGERVILSMPYGAAAGLGELLWQVQEAYLTIGGDEFTSFEKEFC